MGTWVLLGGWQNLNPICARCPCYQYHPLLRTQHQHTSALCFHSCSCSEISVQFHVAPNHTPHILVVWEVHLPSACHLWAGGKGSLIYVHKTPICTSPFLSGSLLSCLTSLACWHRRPMMQFKERCRLFSLPLPLESSSHLWSLGFTQRFLEKKKRGPQDKYAFNKQ